MNFLIFQNVKNPLLFLNSINGDDLWMGEILDI